MKKIIESQKDGLCPICKEKMEKDDKLFMIGNDRPYFNLYVHHVCWLSIKNNGLLEFIQEYVNEKNIS